MYDIVSRFLFQGFVGSRGFLGFASKVVVVGSLV